MRHQGEGRKCGRFSFNIIVSVKYHIFSVVHSNVSLHLWLHILVWAINGQRRENSIKY